MRHFHPPCAAYLNWRPMVLDPVVSAGYANSSLGLSLLSGFLRGTKVDLLTTGANTGDTLLTGQDKALLNRLELNDEDQNGQP